MKYQFDANQLSLAKVQIKRLQSLLRKWQAERERAINDRKKVADKYYKNVGQRIVYAETQIEIIETKIKEFEDAIKTGYIEI